MNALHSLVACLLLVSLTACVIAVGAGPMSLRSLAKGAFSGIREERREVIKNKAGWEKLWAEHGKLNSPGTNAPAVDFEKEMVIAVTMGTKRTGGYAIEIVGVEVVDKKLKFRCSARPFISLPCHATIWRLSSKKQNRSRRNRARSSPARPGISTCD